MQFINNLCLKSTVVLFLFVCLHNSYAVNTIEEYIVDVRKYGAVEGGNCTDFDNNGCIQNAINYAYNNGVNLISGYNKQYLLHGILELKDNCTLQDIYLNYTDAKKISSLVIKGENIKLKNVTIILPTGAYPGYSETTSPGAIELVDAKNVLIENVKICIAKNNNFSNSTGIQCQTKASNITIRNVEMDYVGWCIIYDDMHNRSYGGIDYSSFAIGQGLLIENCTLGAPDKCSPSWGDAIEINCPNYRFKDLTVRNVTIPKTVFVTDHSDGIGIGIGMDRCDNVLIENCDISNIPVIVGAIHVERSTSVKILNNFIHDCLTGSGFDIGDCPGPVIVQNNYVDNVFYWFVLRGSREPQKNYLIDNNYFSNTTGYGIWGGYDIQDLVISNNKFIKFNSEFPNIPLIYLAKEGEKTPKRIRILNNDFVRGDGINNCTILSFSGDSIYSNDNSFIGYSDVCRDNFETTINSHGIAIEKQNKYIPAGDITIKGNLTVDSKIQASTANIGSTTVAGLTSTGNITASEKVGIGCTDPQIKLDVSDNSIRIRTAKTPASRSAPGFKGQIAWDTYYLYVCTATNTWKRIALYSW